MNDIPAIRDYVDEKSVIFYESENEEALINILKNYDSMEDIFNQIKNNAYNLYLQELTFYAFVKRVLEE